MRLLMILAALAAAAPAYAQVTSKDTAPRTRYIDIIKGESCPRSADPNEIVVCRQLDPESQFRLPPLIRNEQSIARRDNVSQERAALTDSGVRSGGSCSAAGIGGQAGCTTGLNVLGAGKKVVQAVKGEDTVPDKVPQ